LNYIILTMYNWAGRAYVTCGWRAENATHELTFAVPARFIASLGLNRCGPTPINAGAAAGGIRFLCNGQSGN
jgi:hypothetical protein